MNVKIKKVRLVHAEPTTLQRILHKDPRSRVCRHIRLLTLYLISFPEPTIENMCSGLLSFSSSVSLAVYFSHGTNRSRMDRTKSIHQSIARLERTLEAQGRAYKSAPSGCVNLCACTSSDLSSCCFISAVTKEKASCRRRLKDFSSAKFASLQNFFECFDKGTFVYSTWCAGGKSKLGVLKPASLKAL